MPLPKNIGNSDVIVVAQVSSFTPDPHMSQIDKKSKIPQAFSALSFSQASQFQEAGSYAFRVKQRIKGQCDPVIQIHLDGLRQHCYGYGGSILSVGSSVILLLGSSPTKSYVPTEPLMPFIFLSSEAVKYLSEEKVIPADQQVYSLMLESLKDKSFRRSIIFQLRSAKSDMVANSVASYVNDADVEIKDNSLYCMMVNQRVDFIPAVAEFSEELWKSQQSPDCLLALEQLNVRKATSFINKMLISKSYYMRLNSSLSLRSLGDRTSIPYLLLALGDPDPQQMIPYFSYATLHRLIPELGRANDFNYFYSHRQEEAASIYGWWNGYLSGKNTLPSNEEHSTPTLKTGGLNSLTIDARELLFDTDVNVRRKSTKDAFSSHELTIIPYALMCLRDPDIEVSFSSYIFLTNMVNHLPEVKSSDQFMERHSELTIAAYSWWAQQLTESLNTNSKPTSSSQ